MYKILMAGFMIMTLGACAVQEQEPLTYEEMRLRDALEVCVEDADAIVDPPHTSSNMYWNNYFTMCMKTRYGYSYEQIRKLRYNRHTFR